MNRRLVGTVSVLITLGVLWVVFRPNSKPKKRMQKISVSVAEKAVELAAQLAGEKTIHWVLFTGPPDWEDPLFRKTVEREAKRKKQKLRIHKLPVNMDLEEAGNLTQPEAFLDLLQKARTGDLILSSVGLPGDEESVVQIAIDQNLKFLFAHPRFLPDAASLPASFPGASFLHRSQEVESDDPFERYYRVLTGNMNMEGERGLHTD